jgi:diketogulonate reductase-like aldo/keto reductase
VRWALELGYRHIDTAQAYGNEESVGQGIRESGVPRDEIFVTTKFYPAHKDPVAEAERSLERLGIDHADLYIIELPQGADLGVAGDGRGPGRGFTRSIGVSNFDVGQLEALAVASVAPVVDQVQFSPFEFRRGLLEACRAHEIALEAYSPLGTGRHLGDESVAEIANRLGRTPAQVLLRWGIQQDVPVIPKSIHRERIAENARIFDFLLSDADLSTLDALDQTGGTTRALERKWWPG